MQYQYFINKDERGEFAADVRALDSNNSVFEIEDFWIFETGYMDHKNDMRGLREYMVDMEIIGHNDTVVQAN